MKNKDLKTGMILETVNGNFAMVLKGTADGDIVSGDTWQPISEHSEIIEALDVVRVYQPKNNASYLGTAYPFSRRRNLKEESYDYHIIWEKKSKEMTVAEIEKELGYPIKVVKEREEN